MSLLGNFRPGRPGPIPRLAALPPARTGMSMTRHPRTARAADSKSGAGWRSGWFLRRAKARPGRALTSRSLITAAFAALLAALSSLAGPPPAGAATASIATLNGTPVTVNNGPGDQTDPHVSGDWVTYTDNSAGSYQVHYDNLATGQDVTIPSNGGQDLLAGISGTTIVYMHSTADGQSIYSYDISSSGPPVLLDPTPGSIREFPARWHCAQTSSRSAGARWAGLTIVMSLPSTIVGRVT